MEYRAKLGWDQGIPADSVTIRERRVSGGDLSFLNPTIWSSFQAGGTCVLPEPEVFVNVASIDATQPYPAGTLLAYDPNTMDWWLAARTAEGLHWTQAGNTAGFGQAGDGRPFWTGDFTGQGRTEVLFYSPGDHNWWLGTSSAGHQQWALVGQGVG